VVLQPSFGYSEQSTDVLLRRMTSQVEQDSLAQLHFFCRIKVPPCPPLCRCSPDMPQSTDRTLVALVDLLVLLAHPLRSELGFLSGLVPLLPLGPSDLD
jgi:hypothetical protein